MSGVDVDLDRLADYAAGLLDPGPAAEVERLVAAEPAWAHALAALTAAQPRVRSELAGLAAPPVPDDVVERLDAALAAAAPDAEVIDISRRRRPRWSRLAGAATAVAAGVAICVGGLTLVRSQSQSGSTSSAGSAVDGAAAPGVAMPSSAGLVVAHSGLDYTAATLPSRIPSGQAEAQTANGEKVPDFASVPRGLDPSAVPAPAQVPAPLRRLAAFGDLQTCLGLLSTTYGRAPELVDYARFQGKPALVVVLSGSGSPRVVVVGPACGLPASGTDQIYP
jgi:hypothetical protein